MPDPDQVKRLSEAINVSEPIAKALVNRNITTFDEAKAFFRPTVTDLHSPLLMNDMEKALQRARKAIENREKIMIYGDYDVDGTTSTAMLMLFFQSIGVEVSYYINDRHTEGYGISDQGIRHAVDSGVNLIISVDCGIRANAQVAESMAKGIDFIICDHHEPEDLPEALAILNPKRKDSTYPYQDLCGCGVAFKLVQAVGESLDMPVEHVLSYLDFVSLAIAADIVEMTGENRAMMVFGLERIKTNPRNNFKVMAEVCGFDLANISSSSIVFGIGPRINAAGRMNHANDAVQWMIASNQSESREYAMKLETINTQRRKVDLDIFKEADRMVEVAAHNYHSSLTLFKEEWHIGVIGIVASRILEKYYRPTVILAGSDGVLKGSVRSVQGVNVYDALADCKEHLLQYGGHEFAAGLTLEPRQLDDFRAAFDVACEKQFHIDLQTPELRIDAEITLQQITAKFYHVLKQFSPFGPKNQRPVFLTRSLKLMNPPKLLKDAHIKCSVHDEFGNVFDAIGFNMPEWFDRLNTMNSSFDMVYTIDENTWNGRKSLQLKIKDLWI